MGNLQVALDSITSTLLSGEEMRRKLYLEFDGCILEVTSNSPDVVRELSRYYPSFLTDPKNADIRIQVIERDTLKLDFPFTIKAPDPGKTKIKEEYVDLPDGRIVRKRLTGMMFFFGDDVHLAMGPVLENLNQIVNFINNRFIQWLLNQGCLLGHAAGVVQEDRGLAIAGFSGRGKSTLALQMMSMGLKFISNDRLLVQKANGSLKMYGVPKQPRINPGTILHNRDLMKGIPSKEKEKLENLPPDDLWKLEQKHDVIVEEVYGADRFQLAAEMNVLVILNWKLGDGSLVIEPVDLRGRRDLLAAFIKPPGLFYWRDGAKFERHLSESAYLRHLSHCDVYEYTGGVNFEQAAQLSLNILNRRQV